MPTPTKTPVPPSEGLVISSNIFKLYDGSTSDYLGGEVINGTNSNVESVKINAVLRDVDGAQQVSQENAELTCLNRRGQRLPSMRDFAQLASRACTSKILGLCGAKGIIEVDKFKNEKGYVV